jgi:soluble lytic murein transglycosylase-like protein
MRAMNRLPVAALFLLFSFSCRADCFEQAGARYGVAPSLLEAISKVESGRNPLARNLNRDGSEDLGHMQINSRWLGVLASPTASTVQKLLDPCLNTHIGAWILAQNIRASWLWMGRGRCLQCQESPLKRNAYAHRVAARLEAMAILTRALILDGNRW